ncbi:hypothetical protein Cgig2_017879 [Carnegiea gigantea]|uniref:Uncharacterized protein n=1 Tax=Carnegiea gigantea TaxID=171969 RepID=A0A9Q1KZ05_9CARY|nr:hypothetical protein Cgig2_017879 [Carnegiea gigantea]
MGELVTYHFSWDRCGIAFPPSPLPKDFQALCPGFELAMAEQAAEHYELPELPQSWIWLFGDRIYETRFRPKGGLGENAGAGRQEESSGRGATDEDAAPGKRPPLGATSSRRRTVVANVGREASVSVSFVSMAFPLIHNMREVANYVGETFIWHSRSASRPPRPLPEDFHAIFYAMLLGVAHEYTAESMKSLLVGLRWSTFEVWLDCMDCVIRRAQLYRPADEVEVQGARDGQEEGSGLAGPPALSSDEE